MHMHAHWSEGGRFFGMILIEPTCSTSLACCEISFILLISAVPFGSNFALDFGAASNVLAMVTPRWIALSAPGWDLQSDHLGERYCQGTAVCDTPLLGGAPRRHFRR